MEELKLNLTIDEANLILDALGRLPFAQVYSLVAKIQEQARQQINGAAAESPETGRTKMPPLAQGKGHE